MLNISTFNIENDYQVYSSDNAKTIIKYLTNYNIDILALQEVHSKLSADLQVELEKIYYKMNGDFRFYLKRLLNKYNEQVPIITNKHIINTKTTHLPSFPSPLKRIVTKTIISYQEQPISIYNIHLDYKFSSVKERELQEIFDLGELAPLHNIPEANGIKAFMRIIPNVPQVAVFDTSYHQTLDQIHYLYSIPYEYYQKYGIRKYGAHGISISYVAQRAAKMLNKNSNLVNLIVCHLGSGASVTAVKNEKSYDTSMGISPLTGVTMGTRSGDFDPAALQRLMHKTGMNIDEAVKVLNYKSGLLGISGVSSDMRDLIESKDKRATLARKIFINRVVRYVGAYAAELNGVDAIIFTAGIGEHDPGIRAGVMASLKYLGLDPDFKANRTDGEKFISKPNSKVKAMIVPTNEELMIAREAVRVLQ